MRGLALFLSGLAKARAMGTRLGRSKAILRLVGKGLSLIKQHFPE
jgi:hypothetical protein